MFFVIPFDSTCLPPYFYKCTFVDPFVDLEADVIQRVII